VEFKYTVKNKDGALLSGVAEANDAAVAIDALQKRGFIILKLEPVNSTPLFAKQFKILQRVKSKELVNFTRRCLNRLWLWRGNQIIYIFARLFLK